MTTYEMFVDNASLQVHCNAPDPTCEPWVTHDLSTAIDDSILFNYSGSVCEYADGSLHATVLDHFGGWTFAIPTIVLPDEGHTLTVEVTFETVGDYGSGLNGIIMNTLGSTDPETEATISDDYHILHQTAIADYAKLVQTFTIPHENNFDGTGFQYSDLYLADVLEKNYRNTAFYMHNIDTKITQIRTMVCIGETPSPPETVTEEIAWKLDVGSSPNPSGGVTVVGAADIDTALSDSDDSSYVLISHPSSSPSMWLNLRWVPKDLTAYTWDELWLEFDAEVVSGGSAELNWTIDLPYNSSGATTEPYDNSAQIWNAPMTVTSDVIKQHIPLLSSELGPYTGDSGELSNITIAKVIAAAAKSTWPTTGYYLGLTLTVNVGENTSDIKIKHLVLKAKRTV